MAVSTFNMDDDDLHFRHVITQARECAFSEDASAIDARRFLGEILHLESGCVSGNLSGDICENVDELAEIVSNLRVKAEKPTHSVYIPSTVMGSSILLLTVAALRLAVHTSTDHVSFTFQEWIWAAQGGYLGTMVDHLARNGGL
jgi:hypothetical protein